MSSQPSQSPDDRADLALLAVVGVACCICLSVWLIGGLAGALFGEGWPRLGLVASPRVVARLPQNLGDPRLAWPTTVQDGLPGAPAMYLTAIVVLLAGAAVARGVHRLLRTSTPPTGASWATTRQLRGLRIRRPVPGRLPLGSHGSGVLAAEPRQSVLVVAPTQTGKTTGLAIPAILEWTGPVVATSVKTDLLRDTLERRAQLGRVEVFDPAETTGSDASASWTPLTRCDEWTIARRTAAWLTEGAKSGRRAGSDTDFWYSAAAKLLAPLLFAAATSGHTIGDVVTWLDTQDEVRVLEALEATNCQPAIDSAQATWTLDERQRSSVYATAQAVVEAYADPLVQRASEWAEITPERLLDGGANTLYLCATIRDQQRLRPVFVTLIESIVEELYRQAAERGAPTEPGLLLVLDEAANIAPLRDLDVLASTGAGQGLQLVTILQDLAQAHARWGHDRADTIVNNHRARIIGTGVADERTLGYLRNVLGDEQVSQYSRTSGASGRASTTHSTTYRTLASPSIVRQGRDHSAILVYGNLPPARITLRPWYRDRRLRRLARPGG
jgi:type IV secretion system protein VirD4